MPRKPAFPSPMAYWANAYQIGLVMAEAQAVITMRLMGMAGHWSVTPAEDARMVSEKVHAMTKAATDSALVAMRGGSPETIAAAAIKPIRQKTRANARRLGKRGPKKG
ncbi:MAG: antifreeze protein [Paracoccaceae bacterium]|nr:antifreeze protein [Loktanella sp.]